MVNVELSSADLNEMQEPQTIGNDVLMLCFGYGGFVTQFILY